MLQLCDMRLRILVSTIIGMVSGIYCWFLLSRFHLGAADFGSSIRIAQALLAHQNPYADKAQLYPLPAGLFGLPFVALRPELAGGVFYGISSALLAFGLTRSGYSRLPIFFAYPYWAALITAQWSPILMASAFFPLLLLGILAKPQIEFPIAITHLKWREVVLCIVICLFSLWIMPSWPKQWISHFFEYKRFIPVLVFPGPLLALALYRYRDRDAWLLFLSAIMPQRWFYDAFILWLIPKSRREILATVAASWCVGVWRWYHMPASITQVGRWSVLFFYLPMLIIIVTRKNVNSLRIPVESPSAA